MHWSTGAVGVDQHGRPRRTEEGAVTAEAALVMPVLAAVTLALVWMLSLAVAQVRVTDAAREAARAVARGDPVEEARELARTAAPGAEVQIEAGGQRVRVHVRNTVRPPGDLLGNLAAARVEGSAEALVEGVAEAGAGGAAGGAEGVAAEAEP